VIACDLEKSFSIDTTFLLQTSTNFFEFLQHLFYIGMLGRPKGDSGLFFWFLLHPNLPAFAWRATGDISAEAFSMSEPPAWMSLVETATSIHGQAMR